MQLLKNSLIICSLPLVMACGSLQKDLDRAEKDRASSSQRNNELEEENTNLKAKLTNVYVTEGFLWVFGDLFVNYGEAARSCESIQYKLPDETAKAEFLALHGAKFKNSNAVNAETIHVFEKTQTLELGIALCALARK